MQDPTPNTCVTVCGTSSKTADVPASLIDHMLPEKDLCSMTLLLSELRMQQYEGTELCSFVQRRMRVLMHVNGQSAPICIKFQLGMMPA